MRTQNAPTIRLKNYTPPAYTITTVDMVVNLDPAQTRVVTISQFKRAQETKAGAPLTLDGDELNLVSVSINGKTLNEQDYKYTSQSLTITAPPKAKTFSLTVETQLAPVENTKLMGLYQSNGVYCTQCEAEGFRRITYFLDRPDVLAVYTVRLEAEKKLCPVLLSNGNIQKKGKLANGRHFVTWHDPHPKPSYLFAMVGGDLDAYSDTFSTASGRHVDLNIFVEKGKAAMASFAMDALKRSMVWDEQKYGREYDLDIFNIVAVSDFNMGAMENKGLNVFNDKFVLADTNVATDTDYFNIERIIAHEYFHNWTGNRITCRDWFQLCLKEGLTVYRDQEFSADTHSRAVQRIEQVRGLKAAQFSEDAGPLAHPVRPAAYKEINNFYTATVYQKGAELVRMLASLVGDKAYRKSTDLYFKRHDGEAAIVEDWLGAFETAAKIDLKQFAKWYGQAGTPVVEVIEKFDRKKQTYTLSFEQSVPETPGQKSKQAVPIPIRFGLLDKRGQDLTVSTKSKAVRDDLIVLDKKKMTVTFDGIAKKPIPSLLRAFSAPVNLHFKESESAKILRASHDADFYNRWDALNSFAMDLLIKDAKARVKEKKSKDDPRFVEVMVAMVFDDSLEPAFKAQALALPSARDVGRAMGKNLNPDAIYAATRAQQTAVGKALGAAGMKLHRHLRKQEADAEAGTAAGLRSFANVLLAYLTLAKVDGAVATVQRQFKSATNMTDRLSALTTLIQCQSDAKVADAALERFYKQFKDNPLVIDKWFSVQTALPGNKTLARVKKLATHPDFSLRNPNRARSLLAPFAAGNLSGFHRADGKGMAFYADQILKLDAINPQIAARLLTLVNDWRNFEPKRRAAAKAQLQRIAKTEGLSRDTQEIVDRALA